MESSLEFLAKTDSSLVCILPSRYPSSYTRSIRMLVSVAKEGHNTELNPS